MNIEKTLAENEKKLQELPEVLPPLAEVEEEKPKANLPPDPSIVTALSNKYDPYMEAKREFLVTPDMTTWDLARKHRLNFDHLNEMAKVENWESQRTRYLERKLEEVIEEKKKHTNEEDEKIGTFMIQMAVRSLKKRRTVPLSFRESKDFLVEGVKIRRQALGLEKGGPKIVNIINQQQAIIEKYKQKVPNAG